MTGDSAGGGVLDWAVPRRAGRGRRRRASISVSATPSSAPNSSITTISVISGTPAEKSTKSTLTFFEFLITKPITYSAATASTPMTP